MKPFLPITIALGVILVLVLVLASIFRVNQWEQVIITEFGKRVGDPVVEPGLHFKKPFIQKVNAIEKRVLEWDDVATEMPTKDKLFIIVDMFGRWRITDSGLYFERLRDERSALSRLNDILGGETRKAVGAHNLVEIIRTTKDREPVAAGEISDILGNSATLESITTGRPAIERLIRDAAQPKLAEFGIDLLDIRFKRINYNPSVEAKIFERMISERRQIAERFRSQGAAEASRILGQMEREVNRIESDAYRQVQTITGEADAKATAIYADAYDRSDETRAFYRFLKSMEIYRTSLGGDTTAILDTNSPLLRYLQSDEETAPQAGGAPTP